MEILLFFAVLFLLVLVHEFGHFIVAKRTGMRVDEFGIGFPPKLFGLKKGETEYTLNALPIGGFVRIYGEDAIAVSEDPDESHRAFVHRSKTAQILTLIAGVTANVLLAWVLFSAVLFAGTPTVVAENEATDSAQLTVLSVLQESPAMEAGIRQGTEIAYVRSDGAQLEGGALTPSTASAFIAEHESVTLGIVSGDAVTEVLLTPEQGFAEEAQERAIVGISMGFVQVQSLPVHTALYEGAILTVTTLRDVVIGISTLIAGAFTFNVDLSQVAGPVGIVDLVGDAASFGFTALVMFTAFISLNLAVINLLPFPALDGGRLLFVIIEAIRGVPIRPEVAYALNFTGFALLILFMVAVTYNDILRLVG